MNSFEIALARHHTYSLLSQLFLEGLTPALWPYVQAIPELDVSASVRLSAHAEVSRRAVVGELSLDETAVGVTMAVTHQTLFGFNLFPYESIFLDQTNTLGGPATDSVLSDYRRMGYSVDSRAVSGDHVGYELGLLAFLCGAEADAQRDNLPLVALQMHRRQRDFLQSHLLRWLLPLATAVGTPPLSPFYTALANLTLAFVADHAASLQPSSPGSFLPTPPPLLENAQTGLREIARYLLTPAFSGIFLSRDAISQGGRWLRLPTGFGGREQLLTNLLQTAVQYDTLPSLLDTLTITFQQWHHSYQSHLLAAPHLAPYVTPWQTRVQASLGLLGQISDQAGPTGARAPDLFHFLDSQAK